MLVLLRGLLYMTLHFFAHWGGFFKPSSFVSQIVSAKITIWNYQTNWTLNNLNWFFKGSDLGSFVSVIAMYYSTDQSKGCVKLALPARCSISVSPYHVALHTAEQSSSITWMDGSVGGGKEEFVYNIMLHACQWRKEGHHQRAKSRTWQLIRGLIDIQVRPRNPISVTFGLRACMGFKAKERRSGVR